MNKKLFLISLLALLVFSSCSEFNKVVKSDDKNLKYEKAMEYYQKKDYYRAQTLFEELIAWSRLTERGEKIYYYYTYCYYHMKDYYLAAYYFKNFARLYPGSPLAEECLFMSGICNTKNSPSHTLDQSETYEAIKDFQAFLDRYPNSARKDTCNKIIDALRFKLETKAFENAKLYYHTENYKSASIALKSMLDDYPASTYREEAMYLIVKSDFLLAENSIDAKKVERYEQTIKSYVNFVATFPESRYRKETEDTYKSALQKLEKAKQTQ